MFFKCRSFEPGLVTFSAGLTYKARNLASRASTSGMASLLETEPRGPAPRCLPLSAGQAAFLSTALVRPVDERVSRS